MAPRILAAAACALLSSGAAHGQIQVGPRTVYLSGKVVTDDGTPPPQRSVIELVCSGSPKAVANTDLKGVFSTGSSYTGSDASRSTDTGLGQVDGLAVGYLNGCVLRAVVAGYVSENLSLNGRRASDSPDVGTIVIHKAGAVEGVTVSATSLQAPKEAKKSYERGAELLANKRTVDAEKELKKAVDVYPKYAAAWTDLGSVYLLQGRKAEARAAFDKAAEADGRFLKPHLQLAELALQELNWKDLADATGRVIHLDPVNYPRAFFYNSLANFNLKEYAKAEESVQATLKLDTRHQYPKAYYLLGLLNIVHNDWAAAAKNLRLYLPSAPANEAEVVKQQLGQVEAKLASGQGR